MKWLSDDRIDHLRELTVKPDFTATKYRVSSELARGGMGTVYLAEDTELSRQVAIKVLNSPDVTSDLRERMIREARIIARLEHPGIVPVHDFGELPDGRLFYAMKRVRGDRLDRWMAAGRDITERLAVFLRVCEAVAFAHAHGVVHRDLKPENVMVGEFGEVLVLDWGVAKILRQRELVTASEADTLMLPGHRSNHRPDDAIDNTSDGTIIGTRHYMSPEQARGEIDRLGERADVYSLGAVLYFLLTNQSPTSARPRAANPKVSKPAEAICLKAMSPEANARYATAAELSRDVGRLLDAEPVAAYRESVFEKAGRWAGKNRFLILLVLAYLAMRIIFIFTSRN